MRRFEAEELVRLGLVASEPRRQRGTVSVEVCLEAGTSALGRDFMPSNEQTIRDFVAAWSSLDADEL